MSSGLVNRYGNCCTTKIKKKQPWAPTRSGAPSDNVGPCGGHCKMAGSGLVHRQVGPRENKLSLSLLLHLVVSARGLLTPQEIALSRHRPEPRTGAAA